MTTTRAPRVGTIRTLGPLAFFDMGDKRVRAHEGHTVVVTQPGHGAPKNGTMGHCYVDCLDCGAEPQHRYFIGLVQLASLHKEG